MDLVREADGIYILLSLVILSFMLLLLLLHICSICFRGANSASPSKMRGPDAWHVSSFPNFAYGCGGEEGGAECAVCLNLVEGDGTGKILPKCGHAFHAECIRVWLVSRSACPVCRAAVGLDAVVEGGGVLDVRPGLVCGNGVLDYDRFPPLLLSRVGL